MVGNSTKDRILENAVDMFSTLGYCNSNMRELARRVGIKTSSLYYYYPSKDALLNDIFLYFLERDEEYRSKSDFIIQKAKELSVEELLQVMYVRYKKDESFYFMIKIIKIAIHFQHEYPLARDTFNMIFYEKALKFRAQVFKTLIDCNVFEPFDYETTAYLMTSYSITRLIECMNSQLPIDSIPQYYNSGVDGLIALIAPLIRKARP